MKNGVYKMNAAIKQHEWTKFLKFFSDENNGRPTRLGVFEPKHNALTDYWLESGLPLLGVDIDTRDERPAIQITVGNFTHDATNAVKLEFQFSLSGEEDGLDITDVEGRTTVLRFETRPVGS
jgi:hypothetical protein